MQSIITRAAALVFILIPLAAHAQCPADPPHAGDYRNNGTGYWEDPAYWQVFDGAAWVAAASAPGAAMSGTVSICAPDGIVVRTNTSLGGNLLVTGSIAIDDNLALTVSGDVTNEGTISGRLIFEGASFVQNHTFNGSVDFARAGTQTVSGTGSWEFAVNVLDGSTLSMADDLTLSGVLNIHPSASVLLNGYRVLLYHGALRNDGTIPAPGTVASEDSNIDLDGPSGTGTFTASLEIVSGTMAVSTPFAIAGLTNFGRIDISCYICSSHLDVGGELVNHGVISITQNSYLEHSGTLFENDGRFEGRGWVNLRGPVTTLQGTGVFNFETKDQPQDCAVNIKNGATVTLGSDVRFEKQSHLYVEAGGVLGLNGQDLALTSTSSNLQKPVGLVNDGTIAAPGRVTSDVKASIDPDGTTGLFEADLLVQTGLLAIGLDAVVHGDVATAPGGTIQIASYGGNPTLTVTGDVMTDGSFTGGGNLRFQGSTLTNNGTLALASVQFDAVGTISGSGAWANTHYWKGLDVLSGAVLSLENDVALDNSVTVETGGEIDLNDFTLSANGHLFTNEGIIRAPGLVRLSALILDANGTTGAGQFLAPLEIASGSVRVGKNSSVESSVDVRPGATLEISSYGSKPVLTVAGEVNVEGTASGGGFLRVQGASLVNNGAVALGSVQFDGVQTLSGSGTWSNTEYWKGFDVLNAAVVTLANDVTISNSLTVEPGGELSVGASTLRFAVNRLFINDGTLSGAGTIDYSVIGGLDNNGGTISPGNSPGILSLVGNYNHNGASFDVELAGTVPGSGHDQIAISGTASWGGGTVDVAVASGYWPALGDAYTIATCGGVCSGTFTAIHAPSGYTFAAAYGAHDVVLTVTAVPNTPPVADAGQDQTVECDGSNLVTLDGTGSSDPDGDALTYTWSGPFGTTTGSQPQVALEKGVHTVTLTVEDSYGATSTDEVIVTVEDTTPPVITLNGDNPIQLMCKAPYVEPGASALDACDGDIAVQISGAVDADTPGTYTVTYTATDAEGHTATATRTVEVLNAAPANLVVTPGSFDFGTLVLGASSPPQSFTMLNDGGCPLEISALDLVGDPDFAIATPTLPLVLAASEQASFDAVFAPSAAGARGAEVRIQGDDPTVVPLAGTGEETLPPLESPFVMLAGGSLTLDGPVEASGDFHSNGDIRFKKGAPTTYVGSLTAGGRIDVEKDNTIDGDLTAPIVDVDKKASVTGVVTEEAVAPFPLPSFSFAAGGPAVAVPKNGERTLAPGSYGPVELGKGATLRLSAGEYFFESLDAVPDAVMSADVAGGPATVNVVGDVALAGGARFEISGAAGPPSRFLTVRTLGGVSVGKSAVLLGTLVAPHGTVVIGKEASFEGSIAAQAIEVHRNAHIRFHPDGIFAVVAAAEEAEIAEHADAALNRENGLEKNPAEANQAGETMNLDVGGAGPVEPLPDSFALEGSFPNPFNPSTTIVFALPEESDVRIEVFDVLGRHVEVPLSGTLAAGRHQVMWDAARMASGPYFVRMKAGAFVAVRQVYLVK